MRTDHKNLAIKLAFIAAFLHATGSLVFSDRVRAQDILETTPSEEILLPATLNSKSLTSTKSHELRFDFKWAEQFHAMVDAIQSKDKKAFNLAAESLRKNPKADSLSEAIGRDLLLEILKESFDSRDNGLELLRTTWSMPTDHPWDLDILLAMHDVLDLVFETRDPKKLRLEKSFQAELTQRLTKFEIAFGRSAVSKSELSQLAFRTIRRIPDNELAISECERLLLELKDDFGLTSILVERLSSLDSSDTTRWHDKYMHCLFAAKKMLTESLKLRLQFPLAMPKVHIELSRLLQGDALKLSKLEEAANACSEARESLLNDDKLGASQRILSLNTLKELHASALWDGYTLQKGHSPGRAKSQRHALTDVFAPSHVARALQEVADIHRENTAGASKFLGAQLRQASVLLNLLTTYSSTAGVLSETVEIERRFVRILDDDLKPRLATNEDKNTLLSAEASKWAELELVWIEWRMKTSLDESYNKEGSLADRTQNHPGDRKHLLARLERLRGSRHIAHEDRVLTAIGYLYLSYGDYQKAIDALAEIEQNEEFAAQVILCLAHKDSGNFPEARLALSKAKGAESGSTRELIKSFLETELSLAQGENSGAIDMLENILTTPSVSRPHLLQETVKRNVEYHKAISVLESYQETGSMAEQRLEAIQTLKEHIEFEAAKQDATLSFVRVRAACALSSALLQASDDCIQKSKELKAAVGKYEEELRRYKEALEKYNTAPSSVGFNVVSKQFGLIEQEHAALVKLKGEFRELSGFNNEARSYCLQAMKELEGLREGSNDCNFRYPNLAYNVLCLAMRVFLLSPDMEKTVFAAQLNSQGGKFRGMKEISEAARCIALQQRSKLSKEGVFDETRNTLFERYRDAFDLSVELGTSGFIENLTVKDVAFICADTNNRTVSELLVDSQADTPAQSEKLEFVSKGIMAGKKFLSFFVGSDATHVFWRIADDTFHHQKVNKTRSEIAEIVRVYISDYLSRSPGSKIESDALKSAFELQALLFSVELKEELKVAAERDYCVYVIPHGPLFQLPLDTLPTKVSARQTEFLIDICPPLVYLPAWRTKEVQGHTQLNRKSLLTVQPDYSVGKESKDLIELPFASETLQIKPDRSTEPRRLGDEQSFNPSKLLAELAQGYRLVHFGCHGGFAVTKPSKNESWPEQRVRLLNEGGKDESETYLDGAYLELWKPNDVLKASDVLHYFAPSGDNRLKSELVLLSACETQVIEGEAVRYGGNTIKAMGTSFLVAGAENVVASHWKVDINSTMELVTKFMKEVAESPKTRMSAEDYASLLHRERKLLKGNKEFQDPYHWGPFTLSTLVTPSQ